MFLDYLALNLSNLYLCTVILLTLDLTNQKLYYLLIIDLIINGFPFVTIIIILLSYFNEFIFRYLNKNPLNKLIIIVTDYFLFGIILYSIFNKFNLNIIIYLFKNLFINLIIYYFVLKAKDEDYN